MYVSFENKFCDSNWYPIDKKTSSIHGEISLFEMLYGIIVIKPDHVTHLTEIGINTRKDYYDHSEIYNSDSNLWYDRCLFYYGHIVTFACAYCNFH